MYDKIINTLNESLNLNIDQDFKNEYYFVDYNNFKLRLKKKNNSFKIAIIDNDELITGYTFNEINETKLNNFLNTIKNYKHKEKIIINLEKQRLDRLIYLKEIEKEKLISTILFDELYKIDSTFKQVITYIDFNINKHYISTEDKSLFNNMCFINTKGKCSEFPKILKFELIGNKIVLNGMIEEIFICECDICGIHTKFELVEIDNNIYNINKINKIINYINDLNIID